MFAQEAQEVFPLHEIDLAGIDGFCRHFVRLTGNRGAQSENFAGLNDLEDQRPSFSRAQEKFYAALTQHENATRRLAFDKQHGAFWIRTRVFDVFKRLQSRGRKIAKDAVGPHFARQATFDDVQTVWC